MNIDKAAPAPAAQGLTYHSGGEVKARLTIGQAGPGPEVSEMRSVGIIGVAIFA
jgi:hypothetical protein